MKKEKGHFWESVNEAFNNVDIYKGGRIFLAQYRALPESVARVLAISWCESEVCNGGFYQFFSNATGVLAPEALEAFEAIGLKEPALLLRKAMDFFGSEYPRSRAERNKMLRPRNTKIERAKWEPFHDIDTMFYTWLSKNEAQMKHAIDAYAESNQT